VLALVFIRFGLNRLFTKTELSFLDDIIPGLERRIRYKRMAAKTKIQIERLADSANFSNQSRQSSEYDDYKDPEANENTEKIEFLK
jgi:hypothetical protein